MLLGSDWAKGPVFPLQLAIVLDKRCWNSTIFVNNDECFAIATSVALLIPQSANAWLGPIGNESTTSSLHNPSSALATLNNSVRYDAPGNAYARSMPVWRVASLQSNRK